MADSSDTIDPNDLDSIDALLDEAELEAVSDPQSPTAEESGISAQEEATDDLLEDDLLDGLESDLETVEPPPEVESVGSEVEVMQDAPPETEPVVSEPEPVASKPKASESITESRAEDFIQKRAEAVQQQGQNNSTVNEVDSIKKLIIIFSSITIFLMIVAIVIGLWGAMSSSVELDDETITMLETIQASSSQNLAKVDSAEKLTKTFEKKLDAISFQIEQLQRDVLNTEAPLVAKTTTNEVMPKVTKQINEHHSAESAVKHAVEPKPEQTKVSKQSLPVSPVAPVAISVSPELAKKMERVSSQMVSAQRRINEVNRRVKSLQTQYKTLLKEIKNVEKELVADQSTGSKKQMTSKTRSNGSSDEMSQSEEGWPEEETPTGSGAYEYSAPSSPYFGGY